MLRTQPDSFAAWTDDKPLRRNPKPSYSCRRPIFNRCDGCQCSGSLLPSGNLCAFSRRPNDHHCFFSSASIAAMAILRGGKCCCMTLQISASETRWCSCRSTLPMPMICEQGMFAWRAWSSGGIRRGLHKLSGDRSGFWAISVNGPWRIVFRFSAGDAFEVEIVDYH